jgi:polysaccharide export outer membrane protein
MGPIPFDVFAQGEYVGPARTRHVPEYRVRVDDSINFVFRLSQQPSATPYRLEVGDTIEIESLTAPELNTEVQVQPDGTITLRQLGQVPAANRTVDELRKALEEAYKRVVKQPTITVTPTDTNSRLEELRATVDRRFGRGGQGAATRVTPEGTVQLPGIGSVSVQGLTLDEMKREVDARYAELVSGLDVTPILEERAPRYVYVLGEVAAPGRYELTGPTSVMQAIALAGSWNVGANLNQVVVFRRDANWCLMATKLDIRGALYGKRPCPADEIWIRDSDIVVVPKTPILVADEFIELVFTRGIYGVFPVNFGINFDSLSTL